MTRLLNYLIRQILITSGSPLEKWRNKYTFPFILSRAREEKWIMASFVACRLRFGDFGVFLTPQFWLLGQRVKTVNEN